MGNCDLMRLWSGFGILKIQDSNDIFDLETGFAGVLYYGICKIVFKRVTPINYAGEPTEYGGILSPEFSLWVTGVLGALEWYVWTVFRILRNAYNGAKLETYYSPNYPAHIIQPTLSAHKELTMASAVDEVNKIEIAEGAVKPRTKPKRALTAYNLFFKDQRQEILEHGKAGGFAMLAQTIAKRWKAISKDQYEEYAIKARADKSRYEKEMAAWKEAERSAPTENISEKRQIVKEIRKSMASQRSALLPANDKEWRSTVGRPSFCAREGSNGLLRVRMQEQRDSARSLSASHLSNGANLYSQSDLCPRSHPAFDLSDCRNFEVQSVVHERQVHERSSPDSLCRMLEDVQRQLTSNSDPTAFGAAHGFHRTDAVDVNSARFLEYSQGPTMRDYNNTTGGCMGNNLDAEPSPQPQTVFTPGSLRRIFDVDDPEVDQLPEPDFDAPGIAALDVSTQELVNRMLKPHGAESQQSIG